MIKRLTLSIALAASVGVCGPAPALADMPFTPSASPALQLIPDICAFGHCIQFTHGTVLGGIANALIGDQMGKMASANLQQNSDSAVTASQDMYDLTSAVSRLNAIYPSRQGTAIATQLAQSTNNFNAIRSVATEMLGEQGALGAQAAQQDALEQLGSIGHQTLQLQATQVLQQESDVVNADQTLQETLDLGGPPAAGWAF